MTRFGDFEPLCRNTPSYQWCNLFYREVLSLFLYPSSIHSIYPYKQLQHHAPGFLIGASANTTSAPVGVNPKCGIPRVGFDGSIGNIANILACSFSILVLIFLIVRCNSRKAAVGKSTCPSVRLFMHLLTLLQVGSSFVHFSSSTFSPSPYNLSRQAHFSSKERLLLSSLQPFMQVLLPLFSGHFWATLSWQLKSLRMARHPR
jgi:Chitin synthase export chaperone